MHSTQFLDEHYSKIIDLINDNNTNFNQIINTINKYSNFNNFLIKNKDTEINSNDILTKLFKKTDINVELFFIVIGEINKLKGNYNTILPI